VIFHHDAHRNPDRLAESRGGMAVIAQEKLLNVLAGLKLSDDSSEG
jgi:hypothetical protein